ncbi:MAG: right-handed parallel beta-helix repeat-containing protein, partial [Gemmataceae bacterium]|nr:right-handed parallel beta-helix repeat-containing protein [Gemmataceae bacterium]
NTIGGPTAADRNVISGNLDAGISIAGASAGNVVLGNYIGTDATGTAALSNDIGIRIFDGAANNTIGGTTAAARNVISGNSTEGAANGITIEGIGTTGNVVIGNYIGTDAGGTTALGNTGSGVAIFDGASGNLVGGTTAGAGNLISGNQGDGVTIIDAGTTGNVVQGNFIGTNVAGDAILANGRTGVAIFAGASANTVGGVVAGAGNVISGNVVYDVSISGADTNANLIAGNRIGTNAAGTSSLSANITNNLVAIFFGAAGNTVGGSTPTARNVISGGAAVIGLSISDDARANLVEGNYIGTDITGTAALPNRIGLSIFNSAVPNPANRTIDNVVRGNLIAGNVTSAVTISDTNTSANRVVGNRLGVSASGADLGNGWAGVWLFGGAANNTVGGTAAADRNVISGNGIDGVALSGVGTSGNVVAGNYIGTDPTGSAILANDGSGVIIFGGASGNTVGGTTSGAGNVIGGNVVFGVAIRDAGTTGNVVVGNLLGTDATGTRSLSTNATNDTVAIFFGAAGNTIGGSTPAARNIISGNPDWVGVALSDGAHDNLIEGNYIGTDLTGTAALPNWYGVNIFNNASAPNPANHTTDNVVRGNLISGNTSTGVDVAQLNTDRNRIVGNRIGTDATGTAALGNGASGIYLYDGAADNTIGGPTVADQNVIAFNGHSGVRVGLNPTDQVANNSIRGNSIFGNANLGIDLAGDGVTLNDSAGHAGPNGFQNFPVLTQVTAAGNDRTVSGHLDAAPDTTFAIDLYASAAADPSGHGEGEAYLGSVSATTNAAGRASFSFTYTADPARSFLTSTATAPTGSTSEFSGHSLSPVLAATSDGSGGSESAPPPVLPATSDGSGGSESVPPAILPEPAGTNDPTAPPSLVPTFKLPVAPPFEPPAETPRSTPVPPHHDAPPPGFAAPVSTPTLAATLTALLFPTTVGADGVVPDSSRAFADMAEVTTTAVLEALARELAATAVPVGGDILPNGETRTNPNDAVRIELGESFVTPAGITPVAGSFISPVFVTQRRLVSPQAAVTEPNLSLAPEVQPLTQATQVVAATLDGDDSVQLVEALLEANRRRSAPPPARPAETAAPSTGGDADTNIPARPAPAPQPPAPGAAGGADAPAAHAPAAGLARWLPVPAVAALAAGWLWRRIRCRGLRDGKQLMNDPAAV